MIRKTERPACPDGVVEPGRAPDVAALLGELPAPTAWEVAT